jgi:subtilisin
LNVRTPTDHDDIKTRVKFDDRIKKALPGVNKVLRSSSICVDERAEVSVSKRIHRCVALGGALALFGSVLHAQAPERVRVIIGFRQQPGPNEQALVRSLGASIHHTYWLVPAIAAEVPQAALQGLRNNSFVTGIELDALVQEIDAELDAAWGVKRIGSGLVHDGSNKGTGVKVCVIDSGLDYTHPDLAANFIGGYDFVNADNDPFDDRGHGTHVTGTVAARDNNAGVVGVAPEASILAYKILDQNGQGFISDAIAALQACIDAGGQVTNSSFGTQTDPGLTIKAAYDNAAAVGLVNVAAAGNRTGFFGTCTSVAFPARYSSVIAVTATDSNNTIASTSCRGPEAELAAPGVNINSTVPTGSCGHCASSGYRTLSGTSMASPHVAGVAALVISSGIADENENGHISDEVRLRLQLTADDLGSAGRDTNYGYGLVDADEAAPPAPPPAPAAPSNLTAAAVASSRIDLAWTDNSSNESGFQIERCTNSPCTDPFVPIVTVAAGVTAYANTGLQASTTYTYRVRANNAGGSSAYSTEALATTHDETPPAAPSTLTATAVSASRIDLSWSDNSDNEAGFTIERCTSSPCSDAFVPIVTVAAGVTTYSNIGLQASTTYTYRVRASNAGGSSDYSNTASATTQAAAQMALSAAGYKTQGLQKADLTWNGAASANVDVFRNGVKIATTPNDGFHTDNINARGSGSYTYRVCEAGSTICSNDATIAF